MHDISAGSFKIACGAFVALALAPLTAMAFLVAAATPAHADTPGMWVYFHLADGAQAANVENFLTGVEASSYPDFTPQYIQLEIQAGFLAYIPTAMSTFAGVNAAAPTIPGTACATSDTMPNGTSRFFGDYGINPAATPYDATADPYSAYNSARDMGADWFWNAGFQGATTVAAPYPGTTQTVPAGTPIDVALIDTGLSPVDSGPANPVTNPPAVLASIPPLDAPGAIVNGPDFSFESQSPDLTHLDGFGHGTAMANIIHRVAAEGPDRQLEGGRLDGRGRRHAGDGRDRLGP